MSFLDYVLASLGVGTKEEIKIQPHKTEKTKQSIDTKLIAKKPKTTLFSKNKNVAIFCPTALDDLCEIVQFLSTEQHALLNFEQIDNSILQRALDYVGGAVYALGGKVEKVGKGMYLYAPKNIKILNKGMLNEN